MDITVTETLRHSLTVSDSDFQLTLISGLTGNAGADGADSTVAGPKGDTGDAGPSVVDQDTDSDFTADLDVNSLTGNTVLAKSSLGYGAGGVGSQTVDINETVTLNAPSGRINCQPHEFSYQPEPFQFINSFIESTDVIVISFNEGIPNLTCTVSDTSDGSCYITFTYANIFANGNSSEEAVKLNFAIIKTNLTGASTSGGSTS